jgi:four helix bundle protein
LGSSFRDLIVWQRAIQASVAIYRLTSNFPAQEMYGLTSQLRRAAVSVASNIAEGYGRGSPGEYKHFLGVARGSNSEVETQLFLAKELGLGDASHIDHAAGLTAEVGKMLNALMKSI